MQIPQDQGTPPRRPIPAIPLLLCCVLLFVLLRGSRLCSHLCRVVLCSVTRRATVLTMATLLVRWKASVVQPMRDRQRALQDHRSHQQQNASPRVRNCSPFQSRPLPKVLALRPCSLTRRPQISRNPRGAARGTDSAPGSSKRTRSATARTRPAVFPQHLCAAAIPHTPGSLRRCESIFIAPTGSSP